MLGLLELPFLRMRVTYSGNSELLCWPELHTFDVNSDKSGQVYDQILRDLALEKLRFR